MNVMVLNDFFPKKYYLELKNAFAFKPCRMSLTIENRSSNAYIYVKNGSMKYYTENSEFVAEKGTVIYIPSGSNHHYQILDPKTECLQIDFRIVTKDSNFNSCFNKIALPLLKNGEKILKKFNEVIKFFSVSNEAMQLQAISDLYSLTSALINYFPLNESSHIMKQIIPAINYLEQHYNENVSVEKLANICFLSETHFRRIFKAELGVSPLKYKTDIIMKHACSLLLSGSLNISEVSNILGFQNVYYFSKSFKQKFGITPTQFLNDGKK